MSQTVEEEGLLAAVQAAPDDDTARLVYADYLDEQGGAAGTARAEFIRLQIELTLLPEEPDSMCCVLSQSPQHWCGYQVWTEKHFMRKRYLSDRTEVLLADHGAAWCAGPARGPTEGADPPPPLLGALVCPLCDGAGYENFGHIGTEVCSLCRGAATYTPEVVWERGFPGALKIPSRAFAVTSTALVTCPVCGGDGSARFGSMNYGSPRCLTCWGSGSVPRRGEAPEGWLVRAVRGFPVTKVYLTNREPESTGHGYCWRSSALPNGPANVPAYLFEYPGVNTVFATRTGAADALAEAACAIARAWHPTHPPLIC